MKPSEFVEKYFEKITMEDCINNKLPKELDKRFIDREEFSNKLEQLKTDIKNEISYANRMNLTEENFIKRVNRKIEELKEK